MSDQDRMDRAERIRRMREGRRGADEDAAATPDAAASDDDAQQTETTTAATGGGTAATEPPESADEQPADDPGADVDDVVADAVDRVSGATASLPEAAEVDPDAADVTEVADEMESADAEATADDDAADADDQASGEPDADAGSTEETRVLEFTLDDEQYCLDIDYIEEIVKHEHITRVPNTPPFVEGVVDLRGQITTILNPKIPIEKDDTEPGDLIVVFDAEAFDEQGHLGWVVDDVRQVSPVTENEVNHPPMDDEHITGVIDRDEDDQFVIWTTPDLALEEAA